MLIPYLLWVICAAVMLPLSSQEFSESLNLVLLPVIYYLLGIVVWFVPYTILAIGMWFWSKDKPLKSVRTLAMIAPFLFFILAFIEIVAILLPRETSVEPSEYLLNLTVQLGAFSLGFGYLCIGIALGIYKLLQTRRLILEEHSPLLSES